MRSVRVYNVIVQRKMVEEAVVKVEGETAEEAMRAAEDVSPDEFESIDSEYDYICTEADFVGWVEIKS